MDHQLFNDDPFASSVSLLEADIFSSDQLQSPTWPDCLDLDLDDDDNIHDLAPPAANNATASGSRRKLSHNAYERDRRKELNELYSSLRSLLPNEDHTKKMSIPTTVCRVLKYIPELQKEVNNLERKKNELTKAHCKPGIVCTPGSGSTTPAVSATCVNDMEVIVQVSLLCNVAATTLPLSKCIQVLEKQGLQLISSSAYSTFENRTFYTLHLQLNLGNYADSPRLFFALGLSDARSAHFESIQRCQGMDKERSAFCDELERVVRKKAEGS